MKTDWPTKKIATYGAAIIIGVGVVVSIFELPTLSNQFNVLALVLTLAVLLWYTHDTNRIANETVKQTELQTAPIMALYIKNTGEVDDLVKRKKVEQYAVTREVNGTMSPSSFYIALSNMGNGPAFNVVIESDDFIAERYQTRFFAPHKDEHAVQILKKPKNNIRRVTELNGATFLIKCQSFLGKHYEFKYRIVDLEEKVVEFLN